jgi:hypothetical protein
MECSLSKDAISALRQKVYKDITTQFSEGKNVNVKNYIQSIYDLVYGKNESHAQALDAAKVVPAIMNQLQGLNAPFRKGLGTKKVMDVLNALDTFESNDLKGVEEYLDRTAKDNTSLQVMETAAEEPVAEEIQKSGQMTLDFETLEEAEKAQEKAEATETKETTTQDIEAKKAKFKNQVSPIKSYVPSTNDIMEKLIKRNIEDPGIVQLLTNSERNYLKANRAEILKRRDQWLESNVKEAVEKAVKNTKDFSIPSDLPKVNSAYITRNSTVELTVPGNYRVAFDGLKPNSKNEYTFIDKSDGSEVVVPLSYVKKINVIGIDIYDSSLTETTTPETEVVQEEEVKEEEVEQEEEAAQEGKKEIIDVVEEEATGAPSVEVQNKLNEKPQEPAPTPEKDKPKPEPDFSRNNYLQHHTKAIRDRIKKLWNAVVPTFLSSSGIEADWWYSFKKRFRVPRSESKFEYGAQREIISLLENANVDNDGALLNLNLSHGQPGVFLQAVRLDQIQGEYPTELKKVMLDANPNQVMLTYVDYVGNPILFNDNFETSLTVGKPVYSPMRSVNDFAMQTNKDYIQKEQIKQYYKSNFKAGVDVIFNTQGTAAGMKEKRIREKAAKDYVENEWAISAKIENYLAENKQRSLDLDLIGGSMGFIATSQYVFSKLKDVKGSVKIKIAETNDPSLGLIRGVAYITAPSLYGQYIRLEQPGLAESEDLPFVKNLLFEDIQNELGQPLSFSVRAEQLQNYININGKGQGATKVLIKEKGNSYVLQMENLENPQGAKVQYDMSVEADKEAAKKHFDQLLNKLRRVTSRNETTGKVKQDEIDLERSENVQTYQEGKPLSRENIKANTYVSNKYISANAKANEYTKFIHDLRTNVNVSGENVETGKITALEDGTLMFQTENVPTKDFLSRQSFNVGTPDLASDGQLRRTNSYITFQLSDQAYDQMEAPAAEQTKKIEETKEIKEEVSKQSDELNKIDRFNEEFDDDDTDYFKSASQSRLGKKATEKQIKEAKEWYEKSPLSDIFSFKEMFHAVNQKGIAQWTMAGITLFKGSDYSDLYHEAFHAFSQGFLTPAKRTEIYSEVKRKKGTFKDYNGKTVEFKDATDKQVEEYLAEEFRSFMLNDGKQTKKKISPKTLSWFKKLYNALKYMFTDSVYSEVYGNPLADAKINELFQNLKLGNINVNNFALENAEFGKLNSGITKIKDTKSKSGIVQLNYQDSMIVNDMIDSSIAEYAVLKSTNKINRTKVAEKEAQLATAKTEKEKIDLEAEIVALKQGTRYMGMMTQSPELMAQAYKWAKKSMENLADEIDKKILETTNPTEKSRLIADKDIIQFAIDNFGNTESLVSNIAKDGEQITGVMGYHLSKTGLFSSKVLLENENTNEDEATGDRLSSQSGNEVSLIDLAKPEVIFLLRTLPDIQNGVKQTNRFGMTKLAPFNATWNRLARALQNTNDFEVMYSKLQDLALEYEPIKALIDRLGDPSSSKLRSEHNLQSAFFQTFAKARVPLIQQTIENNESRIGEAFNTDFNVGRRWEGDFKATLKGTNPYVLTDDSGNYLNIDKILKDFPRGRALSSKGNSRLDFYKALGFNFTNVKEINSQIREDKYNPQFLYDKLVSIKNGTNEIKRVEDFKNLMSTEKGLWNRLQNLEARYSDVFSNFAVTNAEGNMQFEHTLNNSMSIMINSVNESANYQELISKDYMSHLNVDNNPFAESSLWLKSMFKLDLDKSDPEYGQPRYYKGERVQLKLVNLSGVAVGEAEASKEGVASASADKFAKFILDLHASYDGTSELMRHADKGTSYAVSITGNFEGVGRGTDNYVKIEDFKDESTYKIQTYNRLLPHILAEMKRIKIMTDLNNENIESIKKNGKGIENFDFEYIKKGLNFSAFDNVLRQETQSKLKELIGKDNISLENLDDFKEVLLNDSTLRMAIQKDLSDYFEAQVKEVTNIAKEANFVGDNILKDVRKKTGIKSEDGSKEKEILIKSYVHNNWIHNIESIAFLYGDLAQYDEAKAGFHKRNAGIGSTGTIYRTDTYMQDHINNTLWKTSYAAKKGIPQRMFDGKFNTAIMENQNILSAYKKELIEELGEEKAKAYGLIKDGKVKGQDEADAQAFISFDSYRQLKVAEGTWSNAQEELFQKSIAGEELKPRDVMKFFPVVKGQYWGPLANTNKGLPITAFHKYSLFPMIPGVAKGKALEVVQKRMMEEGIDYITFHSGSKVGNITKTGTPVQEDGSGGSRNFDKLYKDQQSHILTDELIDTEYDPNNPYFTKNTIYLEYLKNQLSIYDEPKGSVIFSTQLRKLIEDGLMKDAVPIDFTGTKLEWNRISSESAKEAKSPYYKLLRTYERNLSKLTEIAKDKLLEEMDWKSEVVNGKENLTGDIKNLIAFVKTELTRQDLADHEIDFLEYDQNGQLKVDLSLHLNVEKIEKLLNALMVKKLVKQKVNGEGLIQVASTLLEDLNAAEGRDFKNPTEDDLAKYGSNDLPFYRKGKGPNGATSAMKVKVALQGDFVNLLQMTHEDGQPIKSRQRLNDMLKNDKWLNTGRNRDMITMVGVRIPVQGLNSMEFMEVYEFLDPSAGSVIVPPTEIVTKSGADFDVDKMTVMMPNIRKAKYKKQGEFNISQKVADPQMWNWTKEELDQEYKDYLEFQQKLVSSEPSESDDLIKMEFFSQTPEELETDKQKIFQELIDSGEVLSFEKFKKKRLGSKAVENDLIMNLKEILSLPTNFIPLVTPNSTDILDPIVEKFKPTARDTDVTNVVHGEAKRTKDGKVIQSPTRSLEIAYNLGKHSSNNIGKKTLGLGAVDNTYNTLFNRIGAYMNPTTVPQADYEYAMNILDNKQNRGTPEYRNALKTVNRYEVQRILLPHNSIEVNGQKAISLAQLKDANGENNISDVINQLINGWVDIAADDFIFDIQGNQEVSPVLLFMVQAGVPISDAVTLVSSPLVKEYVKAQQSAKSVFRSQLKSGPKDSNDADKFALKKIILERVDPKSNYSNVEIELDKDDFIKRSSIKELSKAVLMNVSSFDSNFLDRLDANIKQDKTARDKGQTYTPKTTDVQALMHYLELSSMANPIRDIKMSTNVDTSRDVSLFEAKDRLGKIASIKEDGRVPLEIINRLQNESPIASFFIQDFQINLLGRMFPLRNHKNLDKFIKENIKSPQVKQTYGTKDITVTNFKSDLVSYVFQNELTYFDINNIKNYRGLNTKNPKTVDVENVLLERGAFVKNGKMYLDKNTLLKQYESKQFQDSTYTENFGLATIPGKVFSRGPEAYIQFVLEREVVRSQSPLNEIQSTLLFKEKLAQVNEDPAFELKEESAAYNNKRKIKYAYELWLRDTALDNINNFDKLFTLKDINYASRFSRIRSTYPELAESFELLNALSIRSKAGRTNLFLNDSKLSGDQKNILFENLQNLQSFGKVRDILPEATPAQIREINKFFGMMPTVAFMQSGMNTKSAFALTQFISQDTMIGIIEGPIKKLVNELDKNSSFAEKYLDAFKDDFIAKNQSTKKDTRVRGKDYSRNITLNNEKSLKGVNIVSSPLIEDFELPGLIEENQQNNIDLPAYKVNENITNPDGSKRFASTNGTTITINPVTNTQELFDYIEGNVVGESSQQKKLVLKELEKEGYQLSKIKIILNTNKLANTFLILHEQDHINNNDKDVYWKSGRDLSTPDKIAIELRAILGPLKILERNLAKPIQEDISPVQPITKVEISSNSTGLAAALTNPTELAKKKGNLTESYPINYNGKTYVDVEAAYQELKNKSEAQTKPTKEDSGNYKLMVELLEAKLTQHPRLVRDILNEGGTEFLLNATHQPTTKNTVWETGGQNWFMSALIDAYDTQSAAESTETRQMEFGLASIIYNPKDRKYDVMHAEDGLISRQAGLDTYEEALAIAKPFAPAVEEANKKPQASIQTAISGVYTYNAVTIGETSITGVASAKKIADKYPETTFIYDGSLKPEVKGAGQNRDGKSYGNQNFHGVAPNTAGITTKMQYSRDPLTSRPDIVRDVDGKANPEIVKAIDENIKNIREHIAQGQRIAFSSEGYGQDMLRNSKSTGTAVAGQTFLYLSEQLYKNFGYVNPGYLTNNLNTEVKQESLARLQENQNITDQEINRTIDNYTDQAVIEFMKNCI